MVYDSSVDVHSKSIRSIEACFAEFGGGSADDLAEQLFLTDQLPTGSMPITQINLYPKSADHVYWGKPHRSPQNQCRMDSQPQSKVPRASVVMTTFRSPHYLKQVLLGYANQTHNGFEIVVGEDGETDETRRVIDDIGASTGLTLTYVSQTHEGFGKTRILNRAIDAAGGDYLIFTDGDCVPQRDFVKQHVSNATHGAFLSGGCVRLERELTDRILQDQVAYNDFTDFRWLVDSGENVSKKWVWSADRPLVADFFDVVTTTRPTFNGHNASAWKQDVVNANGFNLDMRYGGLDRELGERLENADVYGIQIRHRAITFHLDHDRGYVNDADWERNADIRKFVRNNGVRRAEHGLDEVLYKAG